MKMSNKPIAKYRPKFYLNEYENISYDYTEWNGTPVHGCVPSFQLEDLAKQNITKDDLLTGLVSIHQYPRADITGERTPRGFTQYRFVKEG
jgi:hypothetical protein